MFNPQSSRSSLDHQIAVVGASGHTGRFVVAELQRRGFEPIAIGRDQAKLSALAMGGHGIETRVASLDDSSVLDQALRGVAAVINCAGPFLDTAQAVLAAALRANVHYLDVTAEQASALATFEQVGELARQQGTVVMPAMGFYGGLGDLLATAVMGDWDSADELLLMTVLDRWHPTDGTRRTGQRNTAPRLMLTDGELQPLPTPAPTASWTFPEPFGFQELAMTPLTETVLISRHLKVETLKSYLNLASLHDLQDAATPPPEAVDESGRSAQLFLMEVVARRGDQERRAHVRGRDIYAVTAPLVVEAAAQLLGGPVHSGGAFAPGDLFRAAPFLQALTPHHLIYEPGSPS